MNLKISILSVLAFLGLTGVSFAQIPGNPFAAFGLDFYGFFLPWVFTFAIVFGLLSTVKVFGDRNKQVSAALAFVLAFFVTGIGGPQLALFFTTLFGGASFVLAGILVIILFAALVGIDPSKYRNMGALAIVAIVGVILFLGSSGSFVSIAVIGPDIASAIFWLVIIIVAIYFVMHEGGKEEKGKQG